MLTGNDLLAKVRELSDADESDIVRECGYVSTKKDGGERLTFTDYYEALFDAHLEAYLDFWFDERPDLPYNPTPRSKDVYPDW